MPDRISHQQAAPDPSCPHCEGNGEWFGHADDCYDDLCALNGDHHSCGGQVFTCSCVMKPFERVHQTLTGREWGHA